MYDDELDDAFEDDGEIGLDTEKDAYETKGRDDRAFVDQQAKEYDEMKRKKRDEIARAKNERLVAQNKLSAKERELASLELSIRKDEYVETRERVRDTREAILSENVDSREATAEQEVEAIHLEMDREDRERKRDELQKECATLKSTVDELGRNISLLEYELLRS
jgi:chromosome segregation ATPase